MRVNYGCQEIELNIPESNLCFNLCAKECSKIDNVKEEILNAIRNPIGCSPLGRIVNSQDKVAIIADDNTRLTPVHIIIPVLLDELAHGGVKDKNIKLVIAGGSHRPMSSNEILKRFGKDILSRIKVAPHSYKENLVDYGATKRGTRIWINREVMEVDIRLGIGSIIPHLPAGWSGGAKIVLPGVAGKDSVDQLHLLGARDPTIELGKVDTSFREEIEEFAARIGLHFIVNTILDKNGDVVNAVGGHFIKAHRKGVEYARKVFEVRCKEEADVTISSTYPVDYDLFQADKGIFSAVLATRKGGEVVLLSPCYEGIGPHADQFMDLADRDTSEILERIREGKVDDVMGASEVILLNSIKDEYRVTIVSEGLNETEVRKMACGYVSLSSLQDLINRYLKSNSRIGVIHQSAEISPKHIKSLRKDSTIRSNIKRSQKCSRDYDLG